MIQVRFNLGRGKNFRKWKVTYPDKTYSHFDPETVTLVLYNCTLVNSKKQANKIYKGANKRVCAWIECESISFLTKKIPVFDLTIDTLLEYNPRVNPFWTMHNQDVDGVKFPVLYTIGKEVLIKNPTIDGRKESWKRKS